jgi:dihydropteroate synthase
LSRKSLIGDLTGAPVAGRLGGSIALAVLAAERGVRLLRVHDVECTVQALAMLAAVQQAAPAAGLDGAPLDRP